MENETPATQVKSNSVTWWLSSGDSTEGPFPAEHVAEWLRSGQISFDTLACPAGGNQWRRLVEIAEFASLKPPPPLTGVQAGPSESGPRSAARTRFGILTAAIACASAVVLMDLLMIGDVGDGPPALYLLALGVLAALMVTWAIFHYRLWALLPEAIAETTPGKAVGFLFIPFFGCYWVFVSYLGVNRGLNRIADEQGLPGPRANIGLAVGAAIFFVMGYLVLLLSLSLPDVANIQSMYGYYSAEQIEFAYRDAVDQHVGFNVIALLLSSIPGFVLWLLMVLNQKKMVEHLVSSHAPLNEASALLDS